MNSPREQQGTEEVGIPYQNLWIRPCTSNFFKRYFEMTRAVGPGGGTQQIFIRGGLRPEVQPLTLLYTIFHEKGIRFRVLSIDKWYPFHIPCLALCIYFNCCKCTVV